MSITLHDPLSVWSAEGESVRDLHVAGVDIVEAAVPDAERIDVSGCVVTPGLVNAHHHLMQSAFRTLPGTRRVAMRDWLPVMAAAYREATIDGSLTYAAARAAIAEGLLSGVTTVADHQLNWPDGGDVGRDRGIEVADGVARAAREVGARLVFVRGTAGDDARVAAASADAIAEELAPARGGLSIDGMVQVAVGPAGVHSDRRETFDALADVARRRGLRRRTQANEQVDTEIALARYGRRPIDLLDEWGWLEDDVTIAHLCDVTSDEIALLADRRVTATHAPGCDVPMGWGISPVRALLDAGIGVGLGTSGGGSNDAGHLLADARLAMQVSGLVGTQLDARDLLTAATSGSAAGLGRDDLGGLAPGMSADICVWDVSGVSDAGSADPVAGLLWMSPGRRPRHVIVAGRFVVRDYRLVSAEEAEITAALRARVGR
ncbi:amidohydrolase family protein [Microbacterium sp. G2-8]|uniref:amidohydrolase family protein n=1 Tax=Microbacterium sp. G2-8 TaxID=2842454 RepID=UPI001C89AE6B|nr:amidohydrolase family protein [Microbacterium sp. G2-8]